MISQSQAKPVLRVVPNPAGRVPPHDLNAEAAVLSAMILDPRTVCLVRSVLEPESFYSSANQTVCRAIYALDQACGTVDITTVAGWLRDRERLQQVGGAHYLAQLVDATPAVANVSAHAEIVAEKAWLRQTLEALHRRAAEGYGDVGEVVSWIGLVSAEISRLAERCRCDRAATMKDAAQSAFDRLDAACSLTNGVETGLSELDAITGGILPGEVTLITAPTGRGKTSFATNVALHVAAANASNGVLVFSMEQPRAELTLRMACSAGQINAYHVLKRPSLLTAPERSQLISTMRWLSTLPIRIDDRKGLTVEAIRARARQVQSELRGAGKELKLLVIDYAQLLDWRSEVGPKAIKYEGLDEAGKRLCRLAEELSCQIWLIAQLNHQGGIRDCPLLEMHAQNWLDIRREDRHDSSNDRVPLAVEIAVKKQRNGDSGVTARCWWHGRYLLFSNHSNLEMTHE
jgi:replicative DNA helicase